MVKVQIYFTKKLKLLAIASVLLSTTGLIYFQTAEAATGINSQINFQGKVVNKTAGTNVTNGDYDFTFRLYDAASGGTLLWTENHTGVNDVTVTDGIFRVALGSITSLSSVDFNSDSIYLDITFNGEAMGSRIRFASVPYAFNAEKVNGLSVTNNGGNTLNIAANKTFTVSNTISLSGTDSTSFVFPSTSGGTVIVNNISGQSIAGAFSLTGASGNLTLAGTTGLTFSGVGGDITFTNGEKIDNDTDGTIAITGDLDTSGHGAFGSGTSVDTNTVLNVAETINPSANTRRGLQTIATSNTAFASGALYGGVIRGTGTHTGTSSWIAGLNSQATMTGDGTITQAIGNYGSVEVNNASTGTITNGYVFRGIVNATDGTIDTGYGLRIDSASNNGGTGTINNNYGVSIENQTAGGTTNYGLYIAGASTYALWVDSGISRFDGNIDAQGDILDSSGNLTLNDAVDISGLLTLSNGLTLSGGGAITLGGSTGSGQCLIGGASASWGACGGGSGSTNWVLNSSLGTLSPINNTLDLLLGGTSTASAKFAVLNLNSGTPTATVAGNMVIMPNTALSQAGGFLGIGVASPNDAIDILVNKNGGTVIDMSNYNTGDSAYVGYQAWNNTGSGYAEFGVTGTGYTNTSGWQNMAYLFAGSDTNGLLLSVGGSADPMIFMMDDTSEVARFSGTTKLFGLGTASPISQLHLSRPINADFPVTGKSLAIFDQIENQDIFTASHGGTMRFSITKDGGIRLGQTENEGTSGECLKSGGAGAAAVWDTCGGGSSVNLLGQSDGLTWIGNTTTDFAIGGTSTSSAKFVFGGSNAGTPTATFSGDLIINNRPTTSVADMQKWTQITGTAGTIGDGSTTGIASISASVVYNGSLYVGTSKTDGAEVYRYDGINSTWTKVSQTTAGTIASGGTANIDMVKSMTTYNGFLYIGTYEPNSAEIYRYDGGTTWTKVSQTTAGTIRSGGTASIDGVSAFGVNNGKLYTGTMEGGKAELYRYDGGTTWTIINTTAGQFVTTNSVAVNAVTNIVSWRGTMFLGTQKNSAADVLRYNGNTGASVFTKLNNNTSGSFTVNGASVTAVNEITNMLVYAGGLVITTAKNNAADVYIYNSTAFTTTVNSWLRLNSSAGTITSGGTANIDNIMSAAVYGGRLYIGTAEANSAQIYRLNADGNWTVVSQNTAGTVSAGGTTGIDAISTLISFNHNSLFSGILEGTSAQGYTYNSSIDQSYALKFNAANSQAGGEQSGQENLGSIFFVASLSANLNNKQGNTGAFVFSHNIVTNYGSYDIAEDYPTRDETLEPGDVVAVDVNEREFVQKSQGAYDYAVIGVYSEKPALRLSQDMEQINGGKAVPVALAGRVPVKVSTENGDIKAGDYLTASSKPGVAMKAKKAGVVIGVAMSSYDGDGIGKVTAFIRSNSYNGSTAEIFTSIDPESSDFSDQVLTQLMNSQTDSKSSVVTDRVIAGLEVITPKITVDTLIAKNIKADSIELPEDFWIKAFSDGGLEIESSSAKEISELKSQIAVLNAQAEAATLSAKSSQEKLIESINEKLSKATESATVSQNNLFSSSLNFDGINIFEGSVRIKGNGLFESMLTVIDTLTSNDLIVNGFSTFFGKTVFKDQVEFERPVAFNSDTGGEVIVKKDERKIEVKFDQEFDQTPIVNVSVAFEEKKDDTGRIISTEELESKFFEQKYEYIIVNKSKTGFTVVLNKKAEDDIYFTWTALQVKDEISLKDRGPN